MTTMVARLTATEGRLFLREPAYLIFALLFPAALVAMLGGVVPGMRDHDPALGGQRPIDLYIAVLVAMAIATVALSTLPAGLATYRERGVLRRLAVTPIGPRYLVAAQLLVNLLAMLAAAALAVAVAAVAYGVPMPARPAAFAGALVLGSAATVAVGLVIAAFAPTGKGASAIGSVVYFPMLFFAGVWTPGPLMPDALDRVADFTPLGAVSHAMQDAWSGAPARPLLYAVMVGYAVLAGAVAARGFARRR